MSDIDFDVSNYDIEELSAILRFNDVPLNKGKITERIRELKVKFNQDKRYQSFFTQAEKRLLDYYKDFNSQTWQDAYTHDNSEAAKVLTSEYQEESKKNKEEHKSLILDQSKDIIGHPKMSLMQNLKTKDTIQGVRNPVSRDVLCRVVNFDSHYREILDPSACKCRDLCYPLEDNKETRLETATNYSVHLNQPLTNVVDYTLHTIEIPNTWYVFSEDYGTNKLKFTATGMPSPSMLPLGKVSWSALTIEIQNGNYTALEVKDALNISGDFIKRTKVYEGNETDPSANPENFYGFDASMNFEYNSITGKFTFSNITDISSITIKFYSKGESIAIDACKSTLAGLGKVGAGGKVDYNLGWLLGFRKTQYTVESGSEIEGIAPFDNYGPKYFLLALDDYNNNKPNADLVSVGSNQDATFKLPSYVNTQTMDTRYGLGKYYPGHSANEPGAAGWACIDAADVYNNARGCSESALNIDLSSNLTKKQQYTVEQIQLARTGTNNVDRYDPPNTPDILARIPIKKTLVSADQKHIFNEILTYENENDYTKRVFFGPVKLDKFKIRLLNDKGFDVNLNDRDWSFSLLVNQLYQF